MRRVAQVTLVRDDNTSAFISKQYIEELDFVTIEWTATHVIFMLHGGTITAYRADRVYEVVTRIDREE